jgi:hypothetical protein
MYGLSPEEVKLLKKLNTPQKIQDYLDSIPQNSEKNGETCMSVRRVIRERKAHCMEGAMLACAALLLAKQKPLILSLQVTSEDQYHALALYKQGGYWGAISKTNHAVLRFRDPVYKTVRELALSYFHEYFLTSSGKKTLRGYSKPVNLRSFGYGWLTDEEDLWEVTETIYEMDHTQIVPEKNLKLLRNAQEVERRAASIKEWGKDEKRIKN